MLIKFITYITLSAIWWGLVGFHPEEPIALLFIIFIPFIILLLAIWFDLLPKRTYFRLSAIIYFVWLLKEILLSSIAVTRIAWRRNLGIKPVLEIVKTVQQNKIGLVTYANSITLTPGTVTVSTTNEYLLVHALDVSFMYDLQEGEMDRKVQEIIK